MTRIQVSSLSVPLSSKKPSSPAEVNSHSISHLATTVNLPCQGVLPLFAQIPGTGKGTVAEVGTGGLEQWRLTNQRSTSKTGKAVPVLWLKDSPTFWYGYCTLHVPREGQGRYTKNILSQVHVEFKTHTHTLSLSVSLRFSFLKVIRFSH